MPPTISDRTLLGNRFHEERDDQVIRRDLSGLLNVIQQRTEFVYDFQNFFHPFVGELIGKLNRESLPGMLDAKFHEELKQQSLPPDFTETPDPDSFFRIFNEFYEKGENSGPDIIRVEGAPKQIDVSEGGSYANYNWELFFHIPLTIAVHLSKNQRFAEAQRWFHYIFDPTSNDTSVEMPKRFWKFLRFRQDDKLRSIDEIMRLLNKPDDKCNETEKTEKRHILDGYEGIKNNPFKPHVVARTRHVAYQYSVVMKYLDNLIAWGDSLFRQDTIETINEATMRYVLAANILGPRPQRIPPRGTMRPKTFAELRGKLDPMGNALEELEAKLPFNLSLPQSPSAESASSGPLFGIGRTLYFCIPHNEKLLGYWDTVADRLFKIRNCMNIEGVVRQLALFDPPIDPGMLVKATAAGIDVSSIVSGLHQPVSPVRALLMIQKALELCGEVRGMGAALLSAIEKGDGERLARLRQSHEIEIQKMMQEVRFLQWKQTQEATESLLKSRARALEQYKNALRNIGKTPNRELAPDTLRPDRRPLTEENFDETFTALVAQYDKAIPMETYPRLQLVGETSPSSQSGAIGQGKLYLNTNENTDLNELDPKARDFLLAAGVSDGIFGVLAMLPLFKIDTQFWGIGGDMEIAGGQIFAGAGQILSGALRTEAGLVQLRGGSATKTAGYERRALGSIAEGNVAALELMQIGRQILGSLIAEQVAHHEYLNIQKQVEHSQKADEFLHQKFSNDELYGWMQGETSRLYYEYYRFAFDTARKAEQTMKRELMRPEVDATDYIKFNYWDSGRKGLLSGEAIHLDVKRMEMAYYENNKREYELTKNVSLRQLNPLALLTLKATGTCEVILPEWLFDLDCPGHYMRRIKNVSLSIPAVTGPYTSLNCTLTLLKSRLRKSALLKDDAYIRQEEDDRFIDYLGATQAIVTSNGNNDSGLFETNLRDERVLPFEGAGVESLWRLELPTEFRHFDYHTISDVILHLRYTAREGGVPLRQAALNTLQQEILNADQSGLAILLSLKHDFPAEWHNFKNNENSVFSGVITPNFFPYFTVGKVLTLRPAQFYDEVGKSLGSSPFMPDQNNTTQRLTLPPNISQASKSGNNLLVVIPYNLAE